MRELRDYQLHGLDALRQTIKQGVKRVVLQLPTGGGKTLMSATIAKGALTKGNRMAFTIPRIILVDQVVEEFWKEGIRNEIGVQQGDHQLQDAKAPIQICSIDTIRARKIFPDAKVVIFDEGHILTTTHKRWMAERPDTIFIALSATPWSKGLGKFFDTLLIVETTKGLIARKYLCPYRVFGIGAPDMRSVGTKAGEFHEGQSSAVMQALVGDIIEHWVKLWDRDKTMVFGVDCAHAKAIQERFLSAGISCGYQDAFTSEFDRRTNKTQFHSGEMRVISSVGTLLLGTDWDVRCIVDCQPTKSEIRHVQKIGRGLRLGEGKEFLTLIDHAGNCTGRYDKNGKPTSLGFPDEIFHDHLDDGKPKEAVERTAPLPKKCSKCSMLRPPGTRKCPNCGHEAGPRANHIHEQDGELTEVTPGVAKQKKGAKREYTMQEKAIFFAELKAYAIQKGRKDGWAAHSFREKFGVWPDHRIKHCAPAKYPSSAVAMWCQSRAIKWAKSKKRDDAHA